MPRVLVRNALLHQVRAFFPFGRPSYLPFLYLFVFHDTTATVFSPRRKKRETSKMESELGYGGLTEWTTIDSSWTLCCSYASCFAEDGQLNRRRNVKARAVSTGHGGNDKKGRSFLIDAPQLFWMFFATNKLISIKSASITTLVEFELFGAGRGNRHPGRADGPYATPYFHSILINAKDMSHAPPHIPPSKRYPG